MSSTIDLDTPTKCSLFCLPREIRDHIYGFVLDDVVSSPVYIRKFNSEPHWKVCYTSKARVPGLLLTSKAMYSEARDYLYTSLGPPRIIIEYWNTTRNVRPLSLGWILMMNGFQVRDLETVLPILRGVRDLSLEVRAPERDDSYCLLLVKWISSVLNDREDPLRRAIVDVYNSPDILNETAKIRALKHTQNQMWHPAPLDSTEGPLQGLPTKGPSLQRSVHRDIDTTERTDFLLPSIAWRNLIYGKSHYYVDVQFDTRRITIHPRQRWTVALMCRIYDMLDIFWTSRFAFWKRVFWRSRSG